MSAGNYNGTYAADKVVISIGGVSLSGTADGDFVTAKYDEDRYTKHVGADGSVSRARNPSAAGTIEIVLSATSGSNDELSAFFNLGLLGGIDNPIPVAIADLSGRSLCAAGNAWLKTTPEMVFGKEIGERTWVFDCADLVFNFGGNN
jgi:hypothetical protein